MRQVELPEGELDWLIYDLDREDLWGRRPYQYNSGDTSEFGKKCHATGARQWKYNNTQLSDGACQHLNTCIGDLTAGMVPQNKRGWSSRNDANMKILGSS